MAVIKAVQRFWQDKQGSQGYDYQVQSPKHCLWVCVAMCASVRECTHMRTYTYVQKCGELKEKKDRIWRKYHGEEDEIDET